MGKAENSCLLSNSVVHEFGQSGPSCDFTKVIIDESRDGLKYRETGDTNNPGIDGVATGVKYPKGKPLGVRNIPPPPKGRGPSNIYIDIYFQRYISSCAISGVPERIFGYKRLYHSFI